MLPPMSPSLNILPSNQQAVGAAMSPPLASPGIPTTMVAGGERGVVGDNTGVGAGPGPLRHPRPLTAADLHLQLEKEQEAVVRIGRFLWLTGWRMVWEHACLNRKIQKLPIG